MFPRDFLDKFDFTPIKTVVDFHNAMLELEKILIVKVARLGIFIQ